MQNKSNRLLVRKLGGYICCMKKIVLTAFVLAVCLYTVAQQASLNDYVYKKEFHKLRDALSKQKMPEARKQLYTGILQNAFGKPAESIQSLRNISQPIILLNSDTLSFFYYRTLYDNYVQLFQYNDARFFGNLLLEEYEDFFSPDDLKSEKEALMIWKAFEDKAPQTITQPDSLRLSLKKDIAGLWNIPVSTGDSTYSFIFDSGAGLSTISETYAGKLGLTIIDGVTVPVASGVTGLFTQSKLGIANEIRIKDMVVRNCIFLVFPDSALSFGGGAYVINGIIGFPVIREMGRLHFTGNDLLVTKAGVNNIREHNLVMDQLKPVIYLTYKDELLPFTFDFGATQTIFSDVFYKRYRATLDKEGTPGKDAFAGASGSKSFDIVKIPELHLACLDKSILLKNAKVSKDPLEANDETYYGNVGQDVIKQFKTMHISFKDCYVYFE
jgi:hypothetical protein